MELHIPVCPVPKPRMTRRDKWAERPAVMKYRAYCDELRLHLGQMRVPDDFSIDFYIEMPMSWSHKKRKRMDGQPHQSKRSHDIDNLLKAFMDAVFEDDGTVWRVRASKRWARKGGLTLSVPQ